MKLFIATAAVKTAGLVQRINGDAEAAEIHHDVNRLFSIRSALTALALVAAGASAAAVAMDRPIVVTHGCLSVGQGVCLSGTTEWVAAAAQKSDRSNTLLLAMAGDAI